MNNWNLRIFILAACTTLTAMTTGANAEGLLQPKSMDSRSIRDVYSNDDVVSFSDEDDE